MNSEKIERELHKATYNWAESKNLIESGDPVKQVSKIIEEHIELRDEVVRMDAMIESGCDGGRVGEAMKNCKMELGDNFVSLSVLASQLGVEMVSGVTLRVFEFDDSDNGIYEDLMEYLFELVNLDILTTMLTESDETDYSMIESTIKALYCDLRDISNKLHLCPYEAWGMALDKVTARSGAIVGGLFVKH